MRHGKKDNHLSRTHSHREAMLQNMASSLILHKRIETTLAKAKELRKFVEPILTRAKDDTYQNRRVVFQSLNDKETMKELFGTVADKIASRPGGYTRIIKLGNRLGDNAETCLIELVDFNELLLSAVAEKAATTTKTRRSRRGSGTKSADATSAPVATSTEAPVDEASVAAAPAAGDDLTLIEGIGPKIAELLNNGGITTFTQLADAQDETVQQVLSEAGSSFNVHDATSWNEQAALARDGKLDELKELQDRLKGGKEEQ
ncbi:50S ribosomal protein L17 [Spirosoma endophyticum]|uniref:Large ribosomal subunit protein bL17 n=1 Tax=Spirosoma endophyticum TaxID=662367 RepID=A0A1I1SVQ4_9BACT|nr:50S ribosomal protein L17 [Spirosoma endophyticum]SFD50537.1 large subunit ribosomal protein L17 [Spirosoma endophyticum]